MKALALILALVASPAASNCSTADVAVERLADKYGEHVQVSGFAPFEDTDGGSLFAVYANTDTGTWTALRIDASGFACVVGYGQLFSLILSPMGDPT